MTDSNPPRAQNSTTETRFAVLLFCGLLAFHVWAASVGWKNLNLPGVEFRQTQTAVSALFIQRDHDFSLAYPTPVLGKPWSVPLEFPLYQWTVVWVSNSTGLDLTQSGRAVSLACFYLALPALYLLLAYMGLTSSRRLVALGFVLTCPLYIFYGRAFLIETMALMLGVWFLVGYLRALEHQSLLWLGFAGVVGAGVAVVKVTTVLFVLIPAFIWTVVWLWRQRPAGSGRTWRTLAAKAAWALGTVTLPCLAALWWLRTSDVTKALNPAADFLVAGKLDDFIFGNRATRFSAETWRGHFAILFSSITAWWTLVGAGVLAWGFTRRGWGWIALLVGCFFAVQLIFPILYSLHEYYYVANAFALLLAIGLVAGNVLESRLPRILAWSLILLLQGGQVWSYLQVQYPVQRGTSTGGSPITQALRLATDPDDVLIVAGQDWCSNTPYFAQRRALMFRTGIERDGALITSYFDGLQGEKVGALVLAADQRDNQELLKRAVESFGIDPRPVFTCLDAVVYFHRRLRLAAIPLVKTVPDAQSVQLTPESIADERALLGQELELTQLPPNQERKFSSMTPRPFKYYATFGVDQQMVDGREMLFSHPDTRLWFHAEPGKRTIVIEVQLAAAAYAESVPQGDRSDGIGVSVLIEAPDRTRRQISSRWINPRDRPEDRGLQTVTQEFEVATEEAVVVEINSGPQGSPARDWAMLGRVEIK